ncbi:MAG: type III secretion system export apparatus subunit SctV [Halochromatium sp.]|uniref:type III secretion system export apparatus subunit SctV n=1 Tax=Halochromatium sp. TaxID=2049430 RepID=UPI00397AE2D5
MKAPVEAFAAFSSGFGRGQFSDVRLALGVVAIVALMIVPLPLVLIDSLIAFSMLFGIALLLLAIYIPSPTAFSSFPSVLLLTTLFRLALSIAITRLILLDAEAGAIVESFGSFVVGGNLVVGIVIFLIITIVQFVVIAKGSERVAEVAARFSLDSMPGKQLSIDSDLRSGLIEKDEAKAKRQHLQTESQLHGSLDGAMKFVKGDAIAGIIIIVVNILGGLAIGVLQRGMELGAAMQTYTILTIGDGLVAQIPALLGAIAAGLVVTRTASEENDDNLGEAIGRQISRYPRIRAIAGGIALLLALIPGFPTAVFLAISALLVGSLAWEYRHRLARRSAGEGDAGTSDVRSVRGEVVGGELSPGIPPGLRIRVRPPYVADAGARALLERAVEERIAAVRNQYGVPIPTAAIEADDAVGASDYVIEAHGLRVGVGRLESAPAAATSAQLEDNSASSAATAAPDSAQAVATPVAGEITPAADSTRVLCDAVEQGVVNNLSQFIGTQETSDLIDRWSHSYPQLTKELLRAVPPQRIADVLRRLVAERLSIRHLRDVFEALTDAGQKEKNPVVITEHVRTALKRQISDQFAGEDRTLVALLAHPEFEDSVRQAARNIADDQLPGVEPKVVKAAAAELRHGRSRARESGGEPVLLCSADVRRHIRRLLETEFPDLSVLSFQELAPDLNVRPFGQIQGAAPQPAQAQ